MALTHWKENLAMKIETYRRMSGFGLRELARRFEMSPATLSRIERGYGADVQTLVTLSAKTGFKIGALLGEDKN